MMDIKEDLLLWFTNFLIKRPQVVVLICMQIMKLNKIISFKDNIWGAHLADMQLISKFNKGFRFLLCVVGIFSKYAWVVPLKDKKGVTIVSAFQKVLDKSRLKPYKIWVDKGS